MSFKIREPEIKLSDMLCRPVIWRQPTFCELYAIAAGTQTFCSLVYLSSYVVFCLWPQAGLQEDGWTNLKTKNNKIIRTLPQSIFFLSMLFYILCSTTVTFSLSIQESLLKSTALSDHIHREAIHVAGLLWLAGRRLTIQGIEYKFSKYQESCSTHLLSAVYAAVHVTVIAHSSR